MEQIQSSSYKRMNTKRKMYTPGFKMKKLNATVLPVRVKSTNQMKKKSSKAFGVVARASKAPTNMSSKAVSKSTKGMKGSAKSFGHKTGMNTKRVDQVAPAQRSPVMSPARMVAINPSKQTKGNISNKGIGAFRKSIRRTMGYGN